MTEALLERAPLAVSFVLEEQDLHGSRRWFLRNEPAAWQTYCLQALVAIPAGVLFGILSGYPWVGFLFPIIFAIAMEREQRKRLRMLGQSSGILGPQHVEADEAAVVFHRSGTALRQPWRRVSRIAHDGARTLLLLGSSTGLIIPDRAFPSAEEAQRFRAGLERLREAALLRREAPAPELVAPEGGMGVDFEVTEAMIRAAQLYPLRKAAPTLVFLSLLPLAGTAALALRLGPTWAMLHAAVMIGLFSVQIHLFRRERRSVMANPDVLSRRVLLITPVGLQLLGAGEEHGAAAWTQIKAVESDSRYLYLVWSQEVVTLIPRAAFPTPADSETFLQQMREWHRSATSLPA